jgi:hypothetical protein
MNFGTDHKRDDCAGCDLGAVDVAFAQEPYPAPSQASCNGEARLRNVPISLLRRYTARIDSPDLIAGATNAREQTNERLLR